jgi:hypothetical protein
MDQQQSTVASPSEGGASQDPAPATPGGGAAPASKPLGVVLLALAVAVVGALGLITGISLLVLAFSGQVTDLVTELTPADATTVALALGWTFVIEAGIALVVAYGLFALKVWGWLAALLLLGWRVIAAAFALLTGSLTFGWAALMATVAALLIAYLMTRNVKAAFARSLPPAG